LIPRVMSKKIVKKRLVSSMSVPRLGLIDELYQNSPAKHKSDLTLSRNRADSKSA
jgi:hypothetical protein